MRHRAIADVIACNSHARAIDAVSSPGNEVECCLLEFTRYAGRLRHGVGDVVGLQREDLL